MNERFLIQFPERFVFRYEASGYGDADVTIEYGGQRVVFFATYVGSNPLRDFLVLLPDMVSGYQDHGYMRWSSEPGELKVRIRVYKKLANVIVEEYGDPCDFNTADDLKWIKRLEATLPLQEVVRAVVSEAERNLRIHGIVGLADAWEKESEVFPVSAYLKLKGVSSTIEGEDKYVSDLGKELYILGML